MGFGLCVHLGSSTLLQAAAEAADRPGHEPRESCLMLRKSYVRLFDPPEFGRLCGQLDMITPHLQGSCSWVTALVTWYSPGLPLTSVFRAAQKQAPVCPVPDSNLRVISLLCGFEQVA